MTTEHMTLIEDCEHREDRLDDWSRGFIDSVRRQLEADRELTAKQVEKLEEIWNRATEQG